MTTLRDLPSVERLLQTERAASLIADFGRPLTLNALRQALDALRERLKTGLLNEPTSLDSILAQAESSLRAWTAASLYPVINATGVILHTNLGRAPLSAAAIRAMDEVARGYSNLEFDLANGKRGSRAIHAERLLQKLLGAEAALVVNNCAAAVLLTLSALAHRKRVVVARSQLVEIGGGFRMPDVMKQSGAKLIEVGTTNKVRIADYQSAMQESAALMMRVHRSNFKMLGFVEEPTLKEIADVAHAFNLPLVDDLGSGALYDTAQYGFSHEPTVQESLQAGADVILFSGDKLLGGPQAGIIVGKKEYLDKIKKHPLARAVRADKTCLAGLSATLTHYLKDEARREIPIVKMMALTTDQLKARAEAWREALGEGSVVDGLSAMGGGSLPDESIPTFLLALRVKSAEGFLRALRRNNPPIAARTENDQVVFDPRTVLPEQDAALLAALKKITQETL